MKPRSNMLIAGLLVVAFTTGCQSVFGGREGLAIDDVELMSSVKNKLVTSPGRFTLVSVAADDGTVYLNGEVDSQAQKARAEELAWQVAGVKNVVNNLQISAAGSPAQPAPSEPDLQLDPSAPDLMSPGP